MGWWWWLWLGRTEVDGLGAPIKGSAVDLDIDRGETRGSPNILAVPFSWRARKEEGLVVPGRRVGKPSQIQ